MWAVWNVRRKPARALRPAIVLTRNRSAPPSMQRAACPSAALTRGSLRGFWSSSLIDGQEKAGFFLLDKLHTSVSYTRSLIKLSLSLISKYWIFYVLDKYYIIML